MAARYQKVLAARQSPPATKASNLALRLPDEISLYNGGSRKRTAFEFVDPSEWMAQKNVTFNRYQMDFINDTGAGLQPYTERQLEIAYFSSVYLFAAIRRVANLVSRARIVAEIKKDDKWQRADENILINRIFAEEGADIQSRMYLNYAVYGMAAAYKTKTRKAVMEEARDTPIYDYAEGAVSGLHVLDKPFFDTDEDVTGTDLKGLFVQQDSTHLKGRTHLMRDEFIFFTDWNPRRTHRGNSVVTVAIHKAVTNAAIGRWAAEYFTRGALPMLIVSLANDDPNEMNEADLIALKRKFEQQMQGVPESLRTSFMSRKIDVQQVGIKADEVAAPELDKSALEGIAATVGIARDLIVAPEGGTEERHEQMVMQAWNDVVIPFFDSHLLPSLNKDLGLPENMRLVKDISHIQELDAMRNQKATTEVAIYQVGIERMGEARKRLNMAPDPDFNDWMWDGVAQRPVSPQKIKLLDGMVDEKVFAQIIEAWNGFLIKRSKALELMGQQLAPGEKDGYKFEITPAEQAQAFHSLRTWLEQKAITEKLEHNGNGVIVSGTKDAENGHSNEFIQVAEPTHVTGVTTTASTMGVGDPPPVASEVIRGGESWSSLWLPNDGALIDIQNQLKAMYPELTYEDPAHFHITLTYAPFVTDTDLERVLALLPAEVAGFDIWAGPVQCGSLDFEDNTVVMLKIQNDGALAALQARIAQAYQTYGLELSRYTKSGEFKPHVTLARCSPAHAPINVNLRAILRPMCVCVQRGEYEMVREIKWTAPAPLPPPPPAGFPEAVPDYEGELKSVEMERRHNTALVNIWAKTGVPPEALSDKIVTAIKECIGYIGVFAAAVECIDAGWFDEQAAPDDNPVKWFLKKVAMQETAAGELEAWEKVALRNFNKAQRFEVKSLSAENEQLIRGGLSTFKAHEKGKIKALFGRVRAMEADPPFTVSEDALAEWLEQIEELNDPELIRLISEEQSDGKKSIETGLRGDRERGDVAGGRSVPTAGVGSGDVAGDNLSPIGDADSTGRAADGREFELGDSGTGGDAARTAEAQEESSQADGLDGTGQPGD